MGGGGGGGSVRNGFKCDSLGIRGELWGGRDWNVKPHKVIFMRRTRGLTFLGKHRRLGGTISKEQTFAEGQLNRSYSLQSLHPAIHFLA